MTPPRAFTIAPGFELVVIDGSMRGVILRRQHNEGEHLMPIDIHEITGVLAALTIARNELTSTDEETAA